MISTHRLPLPDCQTDIEWEGTPHSLCSWTASQLTFSYILTQHSTSILLSEIKRHCFTPKKMVTRVSHWEVISLPFCLLEQTWIWTQVVTSLMSSASLLLAGSCTSLGWLCIRGPHPDLPGGWIPLCQAVCWCLLGCLPGGLGGCTLVAREVITHHLHNLGWAPKKCYRRFASWHTGLLRQLARSNACLLCQHRLSRLMSNSWAPRTKESHLYTLASRLQKQKARSNPHMVIVNIVG
jgi:hypothetical protein